MSKISSYDTRLAVGYLQDKYKNFIVRPHKKYLVLSLSEVDYQNKCRMIDEGDNFGFYTIENVLQEMKKIKERNDEFVSYMEELIPDLFFAVSEGYFIYAATVAEINELFSRVRKGNTKGLRKVEDLLK